MKSQLITYLGALLVGCAFTISSANAQKASEGRKIQWESIQDLDNILLDNSEQKKILLYFHTNWCVYCRKMEQSVFTDHEIQSKLKEFILIKFDAESKDSVQFDGITYTKEPGEQFHHLAKILAHRKNQLVFPTIIKLDHEFRAISKSHQYMSRKQFLTFLK